MICPVHHNSYRTKRFTADGARKRTYNVLFFINFQSGNCTTHTKNQLTFNTLNRISRLQLCCVQVTALRILAKRSLSLYTTDITLTRLYKGERDISLFHLLTPSYAHNFRYHSIVILYD